MIKGRALSVRTRVRYAEWMVDRVPLRDMARTLGPHAVGGPIRRHDEGIPVRAWIVDSRGKDTEVDGLAVAWTERAVHVSYFDVHGRQGFAWVWASAVTRR